MFIRFKTLVRISPFLQDLAGYVERLIGTFRGEFDGQNKFIVTNLRTEIWKKCALIVWSGPNLSFSDRSRQILFYTNSHVIVAVIVKNKNVLCFNGQWFKNVLMLSFWKGEFRRVSNTGEMFVFWKLWINTFSFHFHFSFHNSLVAQLICIFNSEKETNL